MGKIYAALDSVVETRHVYLMVVVFSANATFHSKSSLAALIFLLLATWTGIYRCVEVTFHPTVPHP
jgi:disulfide bond formation protein DsbB